VTRFTDEDLFGTLKTANRAALSRRGSFSDANNAHDWFYRAALSSMACSLHDLSELPQLTSRSSPETFQCIDHSKALLWMERGRRFSRRKLSAVLTGPYFRRSFINANSRPFFQVRTFVNGTLYSLLSRPKFRQAARQVDLAALLKAVAKRSDDTCARQIGHVLTQIQSTAEGPDVSESEGSSEGELLRAKVRSRFGSRI
jgi:hypothetical protein